MGDDDGALPFVSKSIRKIDAAGNVIEEKNFMVQAKTINEAVKAFERICKEKNPEKKIKLKVEKLKKKEKEGYYG